MATGTVVARAAALLAALPAVSGAQATESVRDSGGSALWIFANISYAGMRAQNSPSVGWRIVAFIFGFPATLLSFLVIREGGGRMYGIEVPGRAPAKTE